MRCFAGHVRWFAPAAALVCACPPAYAAQDRMELELATLDGSAFVRLSDFPGRAVLINVWDTECPGCVKETALLNAQARMHPQVQFLGIATGDRRASIRFTSQFQVPYPQLQAPKDPAGLLRRLGDPHQGLPFTLLLDAGHRICASRLGEVDAHWIDVALKKISSR